MQFITNVSNNARKAQLAASKFVPKPVARQIGRVGLKAQKHSPQILFVGGVVGVAATAVLASKATLQVGDVLERHEKLMADIAKAQTVASAEEYSENDVIRDKAIVKTKMVTELAKLYALPIGVGVLTVGCFAGGQVVLTKRNAALAAAYVSLEKGFNQYRDRVIAELGADKDMKFRFESEKGTVTETKENGTTTSKTTDVAAPFKDHSVYARFFDEFSKSWQPNAEYNRVFLKCQQQFANDMLRARGHLFLNEVYDMLGIERTKAGAVVGWVWGNGDNFVDFNIFDGNSDRIRDFVNGRESSILLDFNVDGVIYDKI